MYLNYFLWTLLHCFQSAENEALIGGNHRLLSLQRENLHFYADESEQVRNRPTGHSGICVCVCVLNCVLYLWILSCSALVCCWSDRGLWCFLDSVALWEAESCSSHCSRRAFFCLFGQKDMEGSTNCPVTTCRPTDGQSDDYRLSVIHTDKR